MEIHVYHHLDSSFDAKLHGISIGIEKLNTQGGQLMSAISEFAAKQTEFNNRIDGGLTDIATEIDTLNKLISTLQSSAGQITPEDQATLDQLQASGKALAERVDAMDQIKPPATPTDTGNPAAPANPSPANPNP